MSAADPGFPCPLCQGPSLRRFLRHGHVIRDCVRCQHRFAALATPADHVAHIYGDDYFHGGGAGYTDYLSEAELLRDRARWYARRLRRWVRTGTLLDVGAAAGFTLQGFQQLGWKGEGIEPNAAMADHACQQGVNVAVGTLEDHPGRERYDLITLLQVIAHFVDPFHALQSAARLTRPQGYWLIETWDRDSWTARLWGRRWHEYSPPSVLHWFSRRSLGAFLGRLGFREIAHGRPSKWISARHATSLIAHALGDNWFGRLSSRFSQLVPARLVLPYPAEDLFWALYQKTTKGEDDPTEATRMGER